MNLDAEIDLLSPVVTTSPTGQEVQTFELFTTIQAAYNPKMGTETYNDRMIRAETFQVFVIRQEEAPDITPMWIVKYKGQYFTISSVLEFTTRKTTPRGRYWALNTKWRDNGQGVTI
jgi:head-tail adaptor